MIFLLKQPWLIFTKSSKKSQKLHGAESERAVQRAVNFLLFFIGLKMAVAVFSMPGMHPIGSLLVVIIVGALLYGLRCKIGHLSFIFLTIPWREWARKVIQNELFWIGIVFIICAIGRDSTSEWICFLASIIFLGVSDCLFLCRTTSLLLTIILAGVCAILLVFALPFSLSYALGSLTFTIPFSLLYILGSIVITWSMIICTALALFFVLGIISFIND
jgi:hypothetical protein